MTQIIKDLFAYPAFYISQKESQKFFLIILAIILLIISSMFFLYNQIFNESSFEINQNIQTQTNIEESTDELVKEVVIRKGDTLSSILKNQSLPNNDVVNLITLATNQKKSTKLNIGQIIKFCYSTELVEKDKSDLVEENLILNRVSLKVDNTKSIEFVRDDNNNFTVHKITSPLKKVLTRYEATINSSIISSLHKAGMTTNSIIRLINAYSYQLDLQRQIKQGDKITVVAEKFVTPKNEFSHHGKILYASLKSNGNEYNIYLYSHSGKEEDLVFFAENGQSIKSTLLKTPLDVIRVSSHFGHRNHPIHGYGKIHKGVDFAASSGTPIYSAGDGVVQFIGWKSGYGRLVVVKHNNNLSTAYAHASKFAKNIQKGTKVRQSQVIAYVGSSGDATGSHLHYEVRVNGSQVNPIKFKSSPGMKLTNTKLANFNKFKQRLQRLDNELITKKDILSEEFDAIKL